MPKVEQTFDAKEYDFHDITLLVGGQKIDDITNIEYTKSQTKTAIYGKGRDPKAIQRGQRSVSGTISMLQSAYETMQALAPNHEILDLHVDATVCYGNPAKGDLLIMDLIHGIEFTEIKKGMSNTDDNMTVELPFVALSIEHQKNLPN
ncbi:MAG: hypothetical protein MJZ66_02780 [Bacteroidales bacterium]|nr:hypothetical protein [Bacteroidales bacterium]